jgi:crotonobetainyl-CoA:carnitine CoA-transferase CaiB-like acyl-CoA transferase
MGAFRTADGHINIAASSNRLWGRLCEVLDAPELMEDPAFATADLRSKNRATLNERIEAILASRPTEEWWKLLDEVGIPSGPINTVDKVFEDPQAKHLGMAVTVEHSVRGPVAILRQPVNMSRTPPAVRTASPMPGQHRDEILGKLGFTATDIGGLIERGVV